MSVFSKCRRALFAVVSIVACLTIMSGGASANYIGASLPGSASVSQGGAANYSIPIEVPAGINGMQPNLSINYNSNGGNGLLGVGWSLGGLSSIRRCPTNLAVDSAIDGVDFDSNDKFCFGGQRLVAVSGSYGSDGTEYRTQNDSLAKITSHGSAGNGPAWFKVWHKNGRISEYGNTVDSRVEATGRSDALFWAVNKVEDRFGNLLSYEYIESNSSDHRISSIVYGLNDSISTTELISVDFIYESKGYALKSYFAGEEYIVNKRLQSIEIKNQGNFQSSYQLGYQSTSSSVTKLGSVEQCDDNSVCIPATQNVWPSESKGTITAARYSRPNNTGNFEKYTPVNGDFNGDGITDIAWTYAFNGGTRAYISLGTAGGKMGAAIYNAPSASGNYSKAVVRVGDFNGDGKSDLVWLTQYDGGVRAYISLATSNGKLANAKWNGPKSSGNFSNYKPLVGDFNGDGLSDVVWTANYDGGLRAYTALSTGSGKLAAAVWSGPRSAGNFSIYNTAVVGDFNGDGRSDLAWNYNSNGGLRSYIALSKASGSFNDAQYNAPRTAGSFASYDKARVGDFNGDGISDIAWSLNGTPGLRIYAALSKGDGTLATAVSSSPATKNFTGYSSAVIGDFNGDGIDDFAWNIRISYGLRSYISLGKGNGTYSDAVYNAPKTSGNFTTYRTAVTGDYNGDGLDDISWTRGYSGGLYAYTGRASGASNLMSSITNAHGATTKFTYKPLTDASVYTKGSGASFPVMDYQGASRVVSKLEHSDGLGSFNSVDYQYQGLKIHRQGEGSLGFAKVTKTDNSNGMVEVTEFNQDYAEHQQGLPLTKTVTSAAGVELTRTSNDWLTYTPDTSNPWHYQIRLDNSVTSSHDLDGSFLKTDRTVNSDFDAYGQAQLVTQTVEDEVGGVDRTVTSTRVYSNDESNWLMGLLTRQTLVAQSTGEAAHTQVSAWQYDPVKGRLKSESLLHPVTNTVLVKTQYGKDKTGAEQVSDFGHNLATTVSGSDFVTRQSRITYDASGRFVEATENDLGFGDTYSYYAANDSSAGAFPGALKTLTDANGVVTTYKYDGLGRLSGESIGGISSQITFNTCDNSCPSFKNGSQASFYISRTVTGGAESRTYIDELGRTVSEAVESKQSIAGSGKFVFVDTLYNARGQVKAVSSPYFEGDSFDDVLWSDVLYDDLGRVTQTTYPDTRVDTVDYSGYTVTSTKDTADKSQQHIAINNRLGQLITSTDNQNQSVSYRYDSAGNLIEMTDPLDNITYINYDALGRKTSMDDPDQGYWSYAYNGLGELVAETNARQQTTCSQYDTLGRLKKRFDLYAGDVVATDLGAATTATNGCTGSGTLSGEWIYDTADNGKGLLERVEGTGGYRETYSYNSLAQITKAITRIHGHDYSIDTGYDSLARVDTVTYPTAVTGSEAEAGRLAFKNVYDSVTGLLTEVQDAKDNSKVFWTLKELDARGNITEESFGNGVSSSRSYNPATGLVDTISSKSAAGLFNNVQNLAFSFDALGNLDSRTDLVQNTSETFVYDPLNRLKKAITDMGNGDVQSADVNYDALGNIRSKSGVGVYRYGSECSTGFGPHAVCEISGSEIDAQGVSTVIGSKNTSYIYDADGNMTAGDGRTITYASFGKPTRITRGSPQGNYSSDISYGPSRSRYYRSDNNAGASIQTTYVGGLYEKVAANGVLDERHYLGNFAVLSVKARGESSESKVANYLHTDHIGSVTTITDATGNVLEQHSFDAWGKRRAPSLAALEAALGDWGTLSGIDKLNTSISAQSLSSDVTNNGFTGHEQFDGVGLIHMNGRVYDAEIGRFISADPIIQEPTATQSLNRYTYVMNNPLSLIDPTGYCWVDEGGQGCEEMIIYGEVSDVNGYDLAPGEYFFVGHDNYDGGGQGGSSGQVTATAVDDEAPITEEVEVVGYKPANDISAYTVAGNSFNIHWDNAAYGGMAHVVHLNAVAVIDASASVHAQQGSGTGSGVITQDADGNIMVGGKYPMMGMAPDPSLRGLTRSLLTKLEQKAAGLLTRNGGKNSVTITHPGGQVRVDLAGKAHSSKELGNVSVPTPHAQAYKNNIIPRGPRQGQVGSVTKDGDVIPGNFDMLRMVDRYFRSLGK